MRQSLAAMLHETVALASVLHGRQAAFVVLYLADLQLCALCGGDAVSVVCRALAQATIFIQLVTSLQGENAYVCQLCF